MNTINMQSADMLGNFGECMNKQITKLTELNTRALGKMTERSNLINGLIQSKKPEDFIAAQMKMSTTVAAETIQYLQELSSILLEGVSNASQHTQQACNNATQQKEKA